MARMFNLLFRATTLFEFETRIVTCLYCGFDLIMNSSVRQELLLREASAGDRRAYIFTFIMLTENCILLHLTSFELPNLL